MPASHDLKKTFRIGGDMEINRLGYGAMRLTGPNVWGEPEDRGAAIALLRRATELGVNFIDTADSYGPCVSEAIVGEALASERGTVVVATKAGLLRPGPDNWIPCGRPEYIAQQVELSLRWLRIERIDLWQLHRIDPRVPLEETLGMIKRLQEAGKIRHVGLSEVSVSEIKRAKKVVEIATVQNHYNLINRRSEDVLRFCEEQQIGFIPWFPVAAGSLSQGRGGLDSVAKNYGATSAQLALAWLLHRSPVILPIPGTSSVRHLEENIDAQGIVLTGTDFQRLNAIGSSR